MEDAPAQTAGTAPVSIDVSSRGNSNNATVTDAAVAANARAPAAADATASAAAGGVVPSSSPMPPPVPPPEMPADGPSAAATTTPTADHNGMDTGEHDDSKAFMPLAPSLLHKVKGENDALLQFQSSEDELGERGTSAVAPTRDPIGDYTMQEAADFAERLKLISGTNKIKTSFVLGGVNVSFLRLFKVVAAHGGHAKVTEQRNWRPVGIMCGVSERVLVLLLAA